MTTATGRPTATDRPTGVTVMALVAFVSGALDIVAGIEDIGFGGGFLSDRFGGTLDGIMMAIGLVLVLIGVLGVATGIGLWTKRDWAWLIARLWASICVVVGVVNAALSVLGTTLTSAIVSAVVAGIVPAIVAAVVLWYLYQPNVKAYFGRA